MLSLLQELGILISPPTINYDNMGNVSLSQSSFSFANERYNDQLLFCLRQSGFRSASRLTCNLSRLDSESSHQVAIQNWPSPIDIQDWCLQRLPILQGYVRPIVIGYFVTFHIG